MEYKKNEINTDSETVTINKIANGYQLIIQHDQSGSAYGCELSENAYNLLRLHFVGSNESTIKT